MKNKIFLTKLKLALLLLVCTSSAAFSQGLLNNGAFITISSGNFVYVNGGLNLGNFKNQDLGASIGTVKNTGTFDVTGNWTNNSSANVFIANTGLVRLLGANQAINGTTTTYFNNLTLLNSGVKTLYINTLVGGGFASPTGVLTLNHLPLELNSNTLIVNNPATTAITRTSGYIVSETNLATNPSIIKWNVGATNGAYIFPFGVFTAPNYIPLTLTKTAGNTNILASTRPTLTTNNQPWETTVTNMYSSFLSADGSIPIIIDRWWDISSATTFTAKARFTYRGVENTTTMAPAGLFGAQNWDAPNWLTPVGSGPGVIVDTASVLIPSQTLGGIVLTPWVLTSVFTLLPIELSEFNARCLGDSTSISWQIASENNYPSYTLEKSVDGINFYAITTIQSSGNSNSSSTYQYSDISNSHDVNYYRLKTLDINGTSKYSTTIAINNCNSNIENEFDFSLYPNPSSTEVHIDLPFLKANKNCTLKIYDVIGQLVYQDMLTAKYNTINLAQFSIGFYSIQIANETNILTKDLIIAK